MEIKCVLIVVERNVQCDWQHSHRPLPPQQQHSGGGHLQRGTLATVNPDFVIFGDINTFPNTAHTSDWLRHVL